MLRTKSIYTSLGMLTLLALHFGAGEAAAQFSTNPRTSNQHTTHRIDEFAGMLKQAGHHLAAVAAKTSPAVVHIESSREGRNGTVEETGSGVLMSSPRVTSKFVVTNRHVVADAKLSDIRILLSDGRVIFPTGKLEDPYSDIAVMKVSDMGIEPAGWGDSDNLEIGHFVLAMGSPFGLSQSITLGIISAKGRRALELPGRRVINQDFLQTDAAINPGNSGGPLIDLNGRVIGINTAIASQGGGNEGIGFSIPSNLVKYIVGQLLENGEVRRGYLGVELDENFDMEKARQYRLDRKYGAFVTRVIAQTPAANAGLQSDDIILDFDGVEVEDETDLINRVSLTPINKRVRMVVLRRGRKETLYVVLAERQEPQSALPEEMVPDFDDLDIRNTGLAVFELDETLSVQMGFTAGQTGVMVKQSTGIGPDTLQVYDVIEEVARTPISNLSDLNRVLSEHSESKTLVIKVQRLVNDMPASRLILWTR